MPFGRFAVFSRNSTFYNKTQKLGICDEMRAHKLSEIESGLKSFLETEIERQLSDYEEQRAEIVAIENQCIELRKRLGEETHVLVESRGYIYFKINID